MWKDSADIPATGYFDLYTGYQSTRLNVHVRYTSISVFDKSKAMSFIRVRHVQNRVIKGKHINSKCRCTGLIATLSHKYNTCIVLK